MSSSSTRTRFTDTRAGRPASAVDSLRLPALAWAVCLWWVPPAQPQSAALDGHLPHPAHAGLRLASQLRTSSGVWDSAPFGHLSWLRGPSAHIRTALPELGAPGPHCCPRACSSTPGTPGHRPGLRCAHRPTVLDRASEGRAVGDHAHKDAPLDSAAADGPIALVSLHESRPEGQVLKGRSESHPGACRAEQCPRALRARPAAVLTVRSSPPGLPVTVPRGKDLTSSADPQSSGSCRVRDRVQGKRKLLTAELTVDEWQVSETPRDSVRLLGVGSGG